MRTQHHQAYAAILPNVCRLRSHGLCSLEERLWYAYPTKEHQCFVPIQM